MSEERDYSYPGKTCWGTEDLYLRQRSSKHCSDTDVTDQEVADPLVVVVKLRADENMATYLRIKLAVNSRKAEGKGVDI